MYASNETAGVRRTQRFSNANLAGITTTHLPVSEQTHVKLVSSSNTINSVNGPYSFGSDETPHPPVIFGSMS